MNRLARYLDSAVAGAIQGSVIVLILWLLDADIIVVLK